MEKWTCSLATSERTRDGVVHSINSKGTYEKTDFGVHDGLAGWLLLIMLLQGGGGGAPKPLRFNPTALSVGRQDP